MSSSFLQLIVVVGLCHEDPIITIPIKIGTIPIENSLQQGSVDPVGIIAAQPTATAPLLENDENDENVVTPHTYIGKTKFNSRTPKVVYSEHRTSNYLIDSFLQIINYEKIFLLLNRTTNL